MRKTTRRVASATAVAGLVATSGLLAGTASAAEQDIADRLADLPGMTLLEEQEAEDGDRFFLLDFTQPVDHADPDGATFQQRVSVLHTDEGQPTVLHTSGYNVPATPSYSEPTQLLGGNEVGVEHRYFMESVPDEEDWGYLDIEQSANDLHRVYSALEEVYDQNWIATGRSKGGMTATYYRYFFPDDMAGTVAYVAPSNTDPEDGSAYDDFLATVGTQECRDQLAALDREVLERRDELEDIHRVWAEENDATFETVGGLSQSLESAPLNMRFTFWQYGSEADCADLPDTDVSSQELHDFYEAQVGFGADFEFAFMTPYYYQAATQLGSPLVSFEHIEDLVRYPELARTSAYVPPHIDLPEFDNSEVVAVDEWVRTEGTELLYVDGAADPWSAKPFVPAGEANDALSFTAPGANHGALIDDLAADDAADAVDALERWAGVAEGDGPAVYDAGLDLDPSLAQSRP